MTMSYICILLPSMFSNIPSIFRYLCSCGKRPEVQMEVMLFGSYSCLDEQEVALRVYLCNVLYTIKDFKQVSTLSHIFMHYIYYL